MKVKILKEVSSEKQRKYMCAMKDASAGERPDGLSKGEADEMCRSEVKEESNDLYVGGSVERIPSKEEKRKKVVEDLGFLQIKQIGQGNFGTVFRATEGKGKYRDAAVKVIDKGGNHAKKEIKNYVAVNSARQKNKYIAKHFPEVYDVIETDDYAVIVMELLDPTSSGMSVVGDFLRGPEAARHVGRPNQSMKDIDKRYRQRYGDRGRLMKTDLGGRVKNMMLNPKVLEGLIDDFLKNFSLDSDVWEKIAADVLASARGVLNADQQEAQKSAYELEDTLLQFGAIDANTLSVVMKDFENDMNIPWLIMIMIKEIYRETNEREDFAERAKYGVNDLIRKIRETSTIDVAYDADSDLPGHSEEEIAQAEPGAKSIMLAINALMEDFGIVPYDIHDKNALIRSGTNDIVIVDLGNFQEKTPRRMIRVDDDDPHYSPYGMNESKRRIKVFIDRR